MPTLPFKENTLDIYDEKYVGSPIDDSRASAFWHGLFQRHYLLAALSVTQLTLFGILAWWVSEHTRDIDEIKFTSKITWYRSSTARHTVNVFSYMLGSPAILGTGAIPVVAMLWKARLRLEASLFVGTLTLGMLFQQLIKRFVYRPRPDMIFRRHRHRTHKESFPSGHTTTGTVFWGWLLILGMKYFKGKRGLLFLPALFIALTGPARVYLGEHWLSDVLGGYLLGGSYLSLSYQLYRRLRNR